jgi:hypothetical protein
MPKLQRVVLAKLANKARNEKLAVGMGGKLLPVDTFNPPSHSMVHDVDVNNPTKTMDPAA